mgnify:FL=1
MSKLKYLVFTFAFLYIIYIFYGGEGLICPFFFMTKLKCPGCGITTMLISLLRFDFISAFKANAFLLITLPIIIFEILFSIFFNFKNYKLKKYNDIFLIFYLISLICFDVFRNIYNF